MARETKVGLLIGVGVILLIAIIVNNLLVTDQVGEGYDNLAGFAPRTQEDLGAIDMPMPTAASEAQGPSQPIPPRNPTQVTTLGGGTDRATGQSPLIPTADELRSGWRRSQPQHAAPPRSIQGLHQAVALDQVIPDPAGASTDEPPATDTPVTSNPITQVVRHLPPPDQATGDSPNALANPTDTPTRSGPGVVHYVKRGENLSQIARRYYGQDRHWKQIARANPDRVTPNGGVREGARLVIPNLNNTPGTGVAPGHDAASPSARQRLVTVETGDTLSRIAARHLGDAGRYKEIFHLNRDQLRNENALVVGMKLKLPATDATAAPPDAPAHQKQTYTVTAGDTLSSIARKTLGDPGRYLEIYEANKDVLSSPDRVEIGQQLRLP